MPMLSQLLDFFNCQVKKSKKYSIKQLLYSFGLAVIFWLIISMSLYPNIQKTFGNLKIDIDLTNTSAEANDLTLISQDADEVKVQIQDYRTKIGNLKSDDLTVYAVIENVIQAGTYELPLKVKNKDGVNLNAIITPETVTAEFDKYISKEIPIEVSAPNITAKDDYILDENSPIITPSTINITGPQKQVDSISKFLVSINQTKELDNYYTYHSTDSEEWSILDENGGEIDTKDLTFDVDDIQVDFQAYMTKTLKLTYNVINAPSNKFIPNFNMTADSIVVSSSDSSLENREDIPIGDIDIHDVDLNFSKTFDVQLPQNYKNISGIEQVTISLNSNEYKEREFYNLVNFNIVNAPSNYDIELITTSLNTELIGPKDEMELINENDITIKVDLTNVQFNSNIVSAPVTIELTNYPNVWYIGKSAVFLKVTEKTTNLESTISTVVPNLTTATENS